MPNPRRTFVLAGLLGSVAGALIASLIWVAVMHRVKAEAAAELKEASESYLAIGAESRLKLWTQLNDVSACTRNTPEVALDCVMAIVRPNG